MKRERKIFYFKTFDGCEVSAIAYKYEQAEEKAAKQYKIAEYIGWQPFPND